MNALVKNGVESEMKFEGQQIILDVSNNFDRGIVEGIVSIKECYLRKDEVKQIAIAIAKATNRVKCFARPKGSDQVHGCFICDKKGNPFLANICLIVGSQEEADLVKEMIPNARIAY